MIVAMVVGALPLAMRSLRWSTARTRRRCSFRHRADPQPAPTATELRELQRKADQAAKVLEESTPEM